MACEMMTLQSRELAAKCDRPEFDSRNASAGRKGELQENRDANRLRGVLKRNTQLCPGSVMQLSSPRRK